MPPTDPSNASSSTVSGPSLSTAEAVVSCTDLRLSFGGTELVLDGATLAVHEGEKMGLVGRNGCGKSSFLKILAGVDQPDGGDIARKSGLVTGYLPQEFELREDATVTENIHDGAAHILGLLERYEQPGLSTAESQRLLDAIEAADGWTVESRIETLMRAIGTPPGERPVAGLSGGEKRRVALCRALAGQPDLLILDEPTNHLDAESIAWLEDYLRGYSGALIFVTHDRYFLDRIVTRIAELDHGSFFTHEGNYGDYLAAKAERQAIAQATEAKRQSFLRRELQWVRAGVKARTTKARSRLDNFYEIAGQDAPPEELEMDLILPPPPPLGNTVVELENVAAEIDGRRLFSELSHRFEAGRCTGIVGRNGLGKTTLLRILMGQREPETGEVSIGKRTQFNYVDQNRLALDESKSILEEVSAGSDFVAFGAEKLSVRGYLRRFLFSDQRINERISILSGGEKNRVLLAKVLREGGNFLVLDEPTNDLDLPTLRVLEEAILAFTGTVVVVSHDRYFLDRVADQIIAFEGDGQVIIQEGNWSYYREKRQAREKAVAAATSKAKPAQKSCGKPSSQPDQQNQDPKRERPRKLSWKESRELESIEPTILEKEDRIEAIEKQFADPDFYKNHAEEVSTLQDEMHTLQAEVEGLYTRWAELETIRDEAGG